MLLLDLGQLGGTAELKEGRSIFNEPFWIDGAHLSHVLFGCEQQLVIDKPLWLLLIDGTGRMDVDHLVVDEGPVAVLGIALTDVAEVATAKGFLHFDGVLST